MRNSTNPTSNFEGLLFLCRYDYEDVFRALLLGVEEAVARTRKTWKAASTDMAQYRDVLQPWYRWIHQVGEQCLLV